MLKTKNTTYKVILIFNLLCIVAGLVLSALGITRGESTLPQQVACLFNIAALIYAAYYILAGYTKDAAKYYKTYGAIFAIAQIASLGSLSTQSDSYLQMLLSSLILAGVLVLLLSKDLGKQRSLLTCGLLVAFVLICLVCAIADNAPTVAYFSIATRFVLCCLYGIMTFAKYVDKTARGTK